jgi:glutathione S-transferase
MKPRLYYAPGTCALAAHAALREAGAEFDLELVSFADEQQRSPVFLAMNPLGRVPVLETEHGVLTENPAILAYIARAWPGSGLDSVGDLWVTAQVDSFNVFVGSSLHPAFAHLFRPYRYADGDEHRTAVSAKAPQVIGEMFDIVEARLGASSAAGPWVHGARFTTSDPYLCVMSRWGARTGVLKAERHPRVLAHLALVQARPSVAQALAAEGLTSI